MDSNEPIAELSRSNFTIYSQSVKSTFGLTRPYQRFYIIPKFQSLLSWLPFRLMFYPQRLILQCDGNRSCYGRCFRSRIVFYAELEKWFHIRPPRKFTLMFMPSVPFNSIVEFPNTLITF
jgi:hypothetical protein